MTKSGIYRLATAFLENSDGKIVAGQWPSLPIIGWFVFKLLAMATHPGSYKNGFEHLSTAALFTWAYLEIISGASYFRRTLGVIVIAALVAGYFK